MWMLAINRAVWLLVADKESLFALQARCAGHSSRLQNSRMSAMANVQHIHVQTINAVKHAVVADDQMTDAKLQIRILRCDGAALCHHIQFFDGFDQTEIPIHCVFRGIFRDLQIALFEILFCRGFDINAVFLQRLIPCLVSNSLVKSFNSRPCSPSAWRILRMLSA